MRTVSLALAVLFASLPHATAQLYPAPNNTYVQFHGNASKAPPFNTNSFIEANNNFNVSNTVNVTFPHNNQWSWNLQYSDVSIPNISTTISGARVAYMSWNFWIAYEAHKGLQNLNEGDEAKPTCVYYIDAPTLPANVSNAWDGTSSSCASALGNECVEAILNGTYITDDCNSGNMASPFHNDACKAAFEGPWYSFQGYELAASHSGNITTGQYAYWLSSPYAPNDTTIYERGAERLRMMVLTGGEEKGMFCNRVEDGAGNPVDSSSQDDGASGSGGSASGGGGSGDEGDSNSNDAVLTSHVSLVLAAVAVLAAFVQ